MDSNQCFSELPHDILRECIWVFFSEKIGPRGAGVRRDKALVVADKGIIDAGLVEKTVLELNKNGLRWTRLAT